MLGRDGVPCGPLEASTELETVLEPGQDIHPDRLLPR